MKFWALVPMFLSAQTFTNTPLSTGVPSPVHSWLMQEGSGNTFSDSVASNTITASGSIGWQVGPGKLTSGPHFAGTFDTVAANQTAFNPSTASVWSLSTWVSFDSIANTEEILLSQLGTGGQGWFLCRLPSSIFYQMFDLVLRNGAGGVVSRGFAMTQLSGFLYHLVVSVDGSGKASGVTAWINGNVGQPWTNEDSLSGAITPNAPIYFGSFPTGAAYGWPGNVARHTGFQSSTRIYNRVLTQKEVLTLYQAGPMSDSYLAASGTSGTLQVSKFATLDADCTTGAKIGGGTATDNTQKLNAVLLTASQSNPIDLVFNACTVTSGLIFPQGGYTTIEGNGWTSGLFVLSGSNAPAITNGWGIYPVTVSGLGKSPIVIPSQGSSVLLRNFRVNGNRAGNAVGGDLRGGAGQFVPGVSVSSVKGLTLDTVWIYDAPTYAFMGDNLSNLTATNCRFRISLGCDQH